MDKNWLIRTKSNHILGPVSKEKVLELYQNGSIKSDDEICSGNGYWFFIREEDLVARFLLGDEHQSFNPISEAKDVLTHSERSVEVGAPSDDITLVGGLNLSMLNSDTPPNVPERPTSASSAVKLAPSEVKKKNNLEETESVKSIHKKVPQKELPKHGWLKYFWIIGFVVLFLLIYFRKSIIQHVFSGEITSLSIISQAQAQETPPLKKKAF